MPKLRSAPDALLSSQPANASQISGRRAVDQPVRPRLKGGVERDDDISSPAAAASALQWWADAGVDTMIDEAPRDWLRPKTMPAAPQASAPVEPAAEIEALPDQLDLFRAYLASSERLSFATPAAPRVCPAGDPQSGLMILTDMPSSEDCGSNSLLSGEAGRLFDRMLAAIGRDRDSVYLAALSCLRAPGGSLTGEPARQCATLARHHLGLVAPKAALLFGDGCTKALLGLAVVQARGRWHEINTHAGPVRALASFSPDYLLRQPAAKAHAWADLQMLNEGLKS